MNKLHEWVNTAGILLIAILVLVGGNEPAVGASGSRFPNGLSADTTSPVAGEVRGTTFTFTSTGSFNGLPTLNAGILHSYTNSTSTPASMTMKQSDILGYETILFNLTEAAATKSITLPATSTLTSFIPTAGDWQDQCWINSSTTAAATITLVAGTGIDLQTASSSPIDLILGADSTACFKFIRKTNTDISASMLEYNDGD